MNEDIYCFDSAEEAITFLHYHLLDKRTEMIMSTLITRLQRENSSLKKELDVLKNLLETI